MEVVLMGKELVMVTVIGLDRMGIVASISNILAENKVNIEDISQTILDKYFAMIMLVDITHSTMSLENLQKHLMTKGSEMGLEVKVQHENVFKAMHRV